MQMMLKGLVVASVLGLVVAYASHDARQDAKPAQDAQEGGMPMPKPTPEHEWLAAAAGKWKANGKFLAGPDMWVPMTGVQTNTMQPGGLWQVIEFKEDKGAFVGNGISGYDPIKKKFVSVWVDNMGTELSPAEGTLNADKTVLTIEFTKTEPDGKKTKITETATRKDKNTELFEMFQPGPDGKPMKMLEITYTRM